MSRVRVITNGRASLTDRSIRTEWDEMGFWVTDGIVYAGYDNDQNLIEVEIDGKWFELPAWVTFA